MGSATKRTHGLKFIDSNAKLAIVCFDLCVSCPSILLTRLALVNKVFRPEQVPNAVTQSFPNVAARGT